MAKSVKPRRNIEDRNGVHCYGGQVYSILRETDNGYVIDGEQGEFLIPKSSKLLK